MIFIINQSVFVVPTSKLAQEILTDLICELLFYFKLSKTFLAESPCEFGL